MESPAGAATLDVVRGWGIKEVAKWAMTSINIKSEHADILLKNEVTGADLLDHVTEEKLILLYKMPGGPAGRIMSAVAAIKQAAVPSSRALPFVWLFAYLLLLYVLRR